MSRYDDQENREDLIWGNYGFLGNPYETKPLSLYAQSELSVKNAYLPRKQQGKLNPSQQLDQFLKSEGGGCVVIEGDVGVGKTSLVNHHRNQWRKGPNSLFTPIGEISAEKDWTKRQFLIDTLSCLARTLITQLTDKELEKDQLLLEVVATTGTYFQSKSGKSYGGSAAGFGAQFGEGKSTTVHKGEISNTQLVDYIRKIIERSRLSDDRGAFIHFDNFEILMDKDLEQCRAFFEDIRDVLQLPNIYFVFVARKGFFQQIISPLDRVRSIFHSHAIKVDAFTEDETVEIINKRYEVLSHKDRRFIKPVDDKLVRALYKIHAGRIRNVMNDIKVLILEYSSPNRVGTLDTARALESLKSLTEEKLDILTKGQKAFFLNLPHGSFSNRDLVELTGKSKQSVGNILRELRKYHFISEVEDEEHVYEVAEEYTLLLKGASAK